MDILHTFRSKYCTLLRIILVMLCGELVVIITLSCLSVSMAGNGWYMTSSGLNITNLSN
jgi:hypothetical protein